MKKYLIEFSGLSFELDFRLMPLTCMCFCFDDTSIKFDRFIKPKKKHQYQMVALHHEFIGAN